MLKLGKSCVYGCICFKGLDRDPERSVGKGQMSVRTQLAKDKERREGERRQRKKEGEGEKKGT